MVHENLMVLNPDKCHFMVLGDSNCTCNFAYKGTTVDDKLTFMSHLGYLIKKANERLHALNRVKCYMGSKQNKLIVYLLKNLNLATAH